MIAAVQERSVQKQQIALKAKYIQPHVVEEPVEGPRLRQFTLEEYQHLSKIGFFQPHEHIELINGCLVMMSPLNPPHSAATTLLTSRFYDLVAGRFVIRCQQPISLPVQLSEPEPDIALVKPRKDAYAFRHPAAEDLFLVVEVSDSTLRFDRTTKKRDYAAAGIGEYWIVNLVDDQLEVYRDPYISGTGKGDYKTKFTFAGSQTVAPLAFPDCQIIIDQIMPDRPAE